MKKNLNVPLSCLLGTLTITSLLTACSTDATNLTGSHVGDLTSSLYSNEDSYITSSEENYEIKNSVITGSDIRDDIEESDACIGIPLECRNYLDCLNYPHIDIDDVLNNPENYSSDIQIYASYNNLLRYGLTVSDVKDELHNIVLHGQVPRCASDEEFDLMVHTLLTTTLNNPFSVYHELAIYVHKLDCPLEHGLNKYGAFSCKALQDEYDSIYNIPLIDYLNGMFSEDPEYNELIKKLPDTSDATLNEVLFELENIVYFGMLPPSGMSDDMWSNFFGLLDSVMDPYDSLFEKYTGLALRVHNKLYPDDLIEFSEEVNYYVRKLKN